MYPQHRLCHANTQDFNLNSCLFLVQVLVCVTYWTDSDATGYRCSRCLRQDNFTWIGQPQSQFTFDCIVAGDSITWVEFPMCIWHTQSSLPVDIVKLDELQLVSASANRLRSEGAATTGSLCVIIQTLHSNGAACLCLHPLHTKLLLGLHLSFSFWRSFTLLETYCISTVPNEPLNLLWSCVFMLAERGNCRIEEKYRQ
jgi:hypothetical protein